MKPKKGQIIICTAEEEDEDLGMSGIVLKGQRGLVVGDEYEVMIVIKDHVPKNGKNAYGSKVWTKEEYERVEWYWHLCYIQHTRTRREFRVFMGNFKPKEND